MEVAAPAARRAARAGGARRGWAVASACWWRCSSPGRCSALPLSFVTEPGRVRRDRRRPAAEALRASLVLALGVGAGTLLLGGSLAALVSFYDFPGRRWLDWALVLPLAMPAYVLVFVLLGQYDAGEPAAERAARACSATASSCPRSARPPARSSCSRSCSTRTSTCSGAARSWSSRATRWRRRARSGSATRRAIARVALPLARPALAAGAALAVMEALADFGAVNLLNYRAMTDAIYRVWYGAFDQAAALQLATVLRRR